MTMKTNQEIAIVALVQSIVADLDLAAGLLADTREAADAGEIDRAIGGLVSLRPLTASMLAQIDAAMALNARRAARDHYAGSYVSTL